MSIHTKIFNLQSKIKPILKDSVNPFFKSKYFDINALVEVIKPLLTEEKLVLLQPLTHLNGKPALKTILIDSESGESIEDVTVLPENSDVQKMGGVITYFRRYAIQSLLFLEAEDDDGNQASGKPSAPATQQQTIPNKEEKICIMCGKSHQGPYPKCIDCWKLGTTKKIVNPESEPSPS